jgi:polysaccharide biosynthesis/export protein
MNIRILTFLSLLVFSSCSKRNLTYFSNLENQTIYTEEITENAIEPVIKPGDLLNITVNSPNPEANLLFNRGEIRTVGSASAHAGSVVTNDGYLVDLQGNIDFPVLGSVRIGGFSKSEVKVMLSQMLLIYLKDPIINIRYLNFRITVVGEVSNPSSFVVPSEKISIIEALGMAGDMTAFGKRDNVLIIRETEGIRSMARLNLNNKEVMNSPYFYLHTNDVVYVEPVRAKAEQANTTRNDVSFFLSIASMLSFILYRFL